MIYIITVHHETNKFLEIQCSFINRYSIGHQVICGFFGFEQEGEMDNYCFVNLNKFKSKEHSVRLNYLYNYCLKNYQVNDDDIIVFLDSDAFPIFSEWIKKIESYLSVYPIAAIQRKENMDKPMPKEWQDYPHPSFCAVINRFWKDNNLKWELCIKKKIYTAGITLKIWLDENKIEWKPLLRTNVINTHPLMFGVYDDIIYHHGCGNRPVFDGVDIWSRPKILDGPDIDIKYPMIPEFNKNISELVFNEIKNDYRFISIFYLGINPESQSPSLGIQIAGCEGNSPSRNSHRRRIRNNLYFKLRLWIKSWITSA